MLNDQTILLPPNPAGNGADANYRLTVMVPKRRYLSYLRERWWVVMVIVALTVSGVVTYETVRKESFVSTAQLYAAGEVQLSMGSILSEDQANYFGTQVELFKTPRIQADAFSRAGIVLEPGQANPYKVDVVRPMSTAILQLRATGPDAESVQRYLEAVINAYLDYKKETRRTTSEDLMESLTREVAKRDAELKAGLEKLAQFQKSNNVAVPRGGRQERRPLSRRPEPPVGQAPPRTRVGRDRQPACRRAPLDQLAAGSRPGVRPCRHRHRRHQPTPSVAGRRPQVRQGRVGCPARRVVGQDQ